MMNNSKREIFSLAQHLVKNGWCQKAFATDANGHPVQPETGNACSYCAVGAIRRAIYITTGYSCRNDAHGYIIAGHVLECLKDLHQALGFEPTGDDDEAVAQVTGWNDQASTTSDDVLSAYNRVVNLN